MRRSFLAAAAGLTVLAGCGSPPKNAAAPVAPPDAAALQVKAAALFKALPADMGSDSNPGTDAKVSLGRMLYYEPRLSKNQDIACSSCHDLANYGVDNKPTSSGHRKQLGNRNSPTTYNAALHIAQFWDGRAADVEAQAQGPILNPVEMSMPDAGHVEAVLKSIPGYVAAFDAAFPGEKDPISYANMAAAIGAFERKLVTPSAFDRFVAGDTRALDAPQLAGLNTFMDAGCAACHNGVGIGGGMYQKIGLLKPYPTADVGRAAITKNEADRYFFKVPSLRNIARTGPYYHDGQVATLDQAIRLMGEHQLGKTLTDQQVSEIGAFLASLTGDIPTDYIAHPTLPASGPKTPKPDPT